MPKTSQSAVVFSIFTPSSFHTTKEPLIIHQSLSPATFAQQTSDHLPIKSSTTTIDGCSTSVFALTPSSTAQNPTAADPLQHKRRRRRRQRSTERRYGIMHLDHVIKRPPPTEQSSLPNLTIQWEDTDVWRQEVARRPEMTRCQLVKMIEAAHSLVELSTGSDQRFLEQVVVDA
ncbi:hypothetical protein DFQ30_004320 [Apophysomyces sp. BC1015]|nr:hypothetical protein DFQ30_004320 [Apophysomyces sp. BC1015]